MDMIDPGVCKGCRTMLRKARIFARDDSGAVTVDHVVLTAATMGLGLAVIGTISGGLNTASSTVSTQVGRNIIATSFFQAVTQGLTQTALIQPGEVTNHLLNTKQFAFKMDVTLNPEDEGILFEMGGSVHGSILYQHDGKLYLQGGDGRAAGAASNRGEVVWDVREGAYTLEGSLDSDNGLALYVNGELVGQSTFQHQYLGGGDLASVGGTSPDVARNHGNFRRGDTHPGAGVATIFKDQTTGGEVASGT